MIRNHLKGLVFGFSILVSALFVTPATGSEFVEGVVTKNVDGDTLWVNAEEKGDAPVNRERMKIRMIGIDAPETHLPTPNGVVGQGEYGERASEEMARLAPLNADVTVEDQGLDMYKRTLGRVFRDGKDVNLAMIKTGWAIPYIICSGPTCNAKYFVEEKVGDYLKACDAARSAGKGIFDPADPLEEMPFEFRLRHQERDPDKWVGDFYTKVLVKPEDYAEIDLCRRVFFMRLSEARRAGYDYAKGNGG